MNYDTRQRLKLLATIVATLGAIPVIVALGERWPSDAAAVAPEPRPQTDIAPQMRLAAAAEYFVSTQIPNIASPRWGDETFTDLGEKTYAATGWVEGRTKDRGLMMRFHWKVKFQFSQAGDVTMVGQATLF